MHTIRYKKCLAQQDNKTLLLTISKGDSHAEYDPGKKLSAKEMRTMVNRFLAGGPADD